MFVYHFFFRTLINLNKQTIVELFFLALFLKDTLLKHPLLNHHSQDKVSGRHPRQLKDTLKKNPSWKQSDVQKQRIEMISVMFMGLMWHKRAWNIRIKQHNTESSSFQIIYTWQRERWAKNGKSLGTMIILSSYYFCISSTTSCFCLIQCTWALVLTVQTWIHLQGYHFILVCFGMPLN